MKLLVYNATFPTLCQALQGKLAGTGTLEKDDIDAVRYCCLGQTSGGLAIGTAHETGIQQHRMSAGKRGTGFVNQGVIGAGRPFLAVQSLPKRLGHGLRGIKMSQAFAHSIGSVQRPAQLASKGERECGFACTHQSANEHQRGAG